MFRDWGLVICFVVCSIPLSSCLDSMVEKSSWNGLGSVSKLRRNIFPGEHLIRIHLRLTLAWPIEINILVTDTAWTWLPVLMRETPHLH